jgi:hypothetical protein
MYSNNNKDMIYLGVFFIKHTGLSKSYEVAGYFQKVGGEMEALLCPGRWFGDRKNNV